VTSRQELERVEEAIAEVGAGVRQLARAVTPNATPTSAPGVSEVGSLTEAVLSLAHSFDRIADSMERIADAQEGEE